MNADIRPASNQDIFDVRKIRRLVELMKEHDLSEIDLQQGDVRIQLRRACAAPHRCGCAAGWPPAVASAVPRPGAGPPPSRPAATSAGKAEGSW